MIRAGHAFHAVRVRPAALADVPAILEIEEASFARTQERFNARRIRYLIRSSRAIVIVAADQEHILGWAAALIQRRGGRCCGRIYVLAVHPAAQSKRIGRRLAEHLITRIKQRHVDVISLEVRADNARAIALYRKLGFAADKPLRDYYGKGYHGQRMVRSFTSRAV